MKAVVLAAGLGKRMRPLTFTKPKFLLPVAGKPALDHVFALLKNAGINEVGIVVGFGKEQIMDRYGDGSKLGLKLEYLHQRELLGTANAVLMAEDFVGGERFVVMNGDILVDQESLNRILKSHEEFSSNGDFGGIMGTIEVDEPEQFGIVFMEGKKVVEIVEKPKRIKSRVANAGIYLFDPVIFDAIRKTKRSKRGEYELTVSMQILVDQGKAIYTSPLNLWADIGRPWDLLVANEYFLRGQRGEIHGKVEVGANVEDNVYVGDGSIIRSGSYIRGPTYIGKNCDIGPNCFIRPSTSIGNNVRIGNAVEVKNSIVMDDTNIGHLSYVGDSVIGNNCNLGAGTTIANLRLDEKPVKMKIGGKVIDSGRRKLGTIIADNVKTGINCTINVGVKIGPNSAIGPGAVVYKDVPPNVMVFVEPVVKKKKWVPEVSRNGPVR
ncbi:MAG: glucose-1-phosphate thymidylyltransferase [Hadesarchaea archaeon]|nr:MAG: glucose-1-phosphate thymidylyltransferase [Hadesarchaea archaeon]HDI12481.1 glucose-1-phosphate thymidylyltransferase [Hadesarchaea archaeon]